MVWYLYDRSGSMELNKWVKEDMSLILEQHIVLFWDKQEFSTLCSQLFWSLVGYYWLFLIHSLVLEDISLDSVFFSLKIASGVILVMGPLILIFWAGFSLGYSTYCYSEGYIVIWMFLSNIVQELIWAFSLAIADAYGFLWFILVIN